MVGCESSTASERKFIGFIPILAAVALLGLVSLGIGSSRYPQLDFGIHPRFGDGWVQLILPLVVAVCGAVFKSRSDFSFAGVCCLVFAAMNFYQLWFVHMVEIVWVSAWFWHVGSLVLVGLMLIGSAFTLPRSEHLAGFRWHPPFSSIFAHAEARRCFARAPLVLQLFSVFAVCMAIAEFSLVLVEVWPPGTVMAVGYPVVLGLVWISVQDDETRRLGVSNAALTLTFFGGVVVFSAYNAGDLAGGSVLNAIRIVMPLFCASILVSPCMLKWSGIVKMSAYIPFQLAIADWVYISSAVAVAIAACIAIIGRA